MFTKPTQPTELETYDNALHTLIADRDKMIDRQTHGIYKLTDTEVERQNTLIECCQLAYQYILKQVVK